MKAKNPSFGDPDDAYILDSAENASVELLYSRLAGACSTCAGQMVPGSVDQSNGLVLDEVIRKMHVIGYGMIPEDFTLSSHAKNPTYPPYPCHTHLH